MLLQVRRIEVASGGGLIFEGSLLFSKYGREVPCVLCYALCSMLCSMLYALCSMLYALCSSKVRRIEAASIGGLIFKGSPLFSKYGREVLCVLCSILCAALYALCSVLCV